MVLSQGADFSFHSVSQLAVIECIPGVWFRQMRRVNFYMDVEPTPPSVWQSNKQMVVREMAIWQFAHHCLPKRAAQRHACNHLTGSLHSSNQSQTVISVTWSIFSLHLWLEWSDNCMWNWYRTVLQRPPDYGTDIYSPSWDYLLGWSFSSCRCVLTKPAGFTLLWDQTFKTILRTFYNPPPILWEIIKMSDFTCGTVPVKGISLKWRSMILKTNQHTVFILTENSDLVFWITQYLVIF